MLVYHNITPPEYFLGVHPWLVRQCYHGRRELLPYRSRVDLALGDSEFNRRELEALGFSPTAVLPVVPDFSHLDVEPDARVYDAFDDEWTNILFVGRLIPNKRPDQLIRYFHAYQRLCNPRCASDPGGIPRALRALPRAAARAGRPARRAQRAHPRPGDERGAHGALRRRRPLPVRERARGLLRADRRGVLQARAGAGLRVHRRAGHHGRRRRALRHARSARRRVADGRRPLG